MNLEFAIRELKKMKPLKDIPADRVDREWERREPFIATVEAAVSDRTYVAERNALIPEASLWADRVTEACGDKMVYRNRWGRNFMDRMAVLWAGGGQ